MLESLFLVVSLHQTKQDIMKNFFPTHKEAKKEADKRRRGELIFDLGKHRTKKRFFVGTEFTWLNISN